jgi:cellobiose-specific phosphotransferase system component IIA
MSGILGKIIGTAGKEITRTIGETVDALSTSDAEKLHAKQKLTETVMSELNEAVQMQQNIIVAEAQGNYLQRSWRPIMMLGFGFIIMYRYFLSPVFQWPAVEVPERFWDLLELGLGGYVIGRSVEKVADTVVKNVDISFVKKKERKV